MSIADNSNRHRQHKWRLCPFWHPAARSFSSSSAYNFYNQSRNPSNPNGAAGMGGRSGTVSSVAKSLLPARRRLRLDPSSSMDRETIALDKLKCQLAEADALVESRKKPLLDTGPRMVGEGLVIDE